MWGGLRPLAGLRDFGTVHHQRDSALLYLRNPSSDCPQTPPPKGSQIESYCSLHLHLHPLVTLLRNFLTSSPFTSAGSPDFLPLCSYGYTLFNASGVPSFSHPCIGKLIYSSNILGTAYALLTIPNSSQL